MAGERSFYVYILTNAARSVLYVGMTNDVVRRVQEHRDATTGFTAKYKLRHLVYYEEHATAWEAIEREKQIKSGSRAKKLALVAELNPNWRDLFDNLVEPE